MRSSASPSRSSVLRQKPQTAVVDAALANSTGAPQLGQAARQRRCAAGAWSAKFLQEVRFFGGEFLVGQDALGLEVAELFQQRDDVFGLAGGRRGGRGADTGQALAERLRQRLAQGHAGAQADGF